MTGFEFKVIQKYTIEGKDNLKTTKEAEVTTFFCDDFIKSVVPIPDDEKKCLLLTVTGTLVCLEPYQDVVKRLLN